MMNKILVIQTAFIGDVILATGVLESLHAAFPQAKIDFLVRKGNEALVKEHPFLNQIIVWDKKASKYLSMFTIIRKSRANNYDVVINLQRFASSGIMTAFSGAKKKYGFDKNPLSFLFTKAIPHNIAGKGQQYLHETERNFGVLKELKGVEFFKPKVYPSKSDAQKVETFTTDRFVTISPASVWETKKFPIEKWIELIHRLKCRVVLLGGPSDRDLCNQIADKCHNRVVQVLAGDLTLLQSAALMSKADMNYTNDSGPLHLASAMNAPTTAVFCSTIPEFGFGPLSDNSKVVESTLDLPCRPCGLHGHKKCPQGHFKCGISIQIDQLI
jgi:lipopolysaccharide heptosyltransferase II